MERYWLNSNKLAIFVEDGVPLWTEHWDGRLSLQAQIRDSCYENVLVSWFFLWWYLIGFGLGIECIWAFMD
ncbi:unnamed protein product [Anisakis simplex]|uniref:Transmembrane protein n=1 Tax=Anisakis simplex TaxID=6269 RepID=A0A0M3JQ02_ANISI|nr:unnamed protein product [Anisakis simplex]